MQLADPGHAAELVRLALPEVIHPSPARAVSAGDVLAGRYAILEEVSRCGMGVVYKALDRHREAAGLSRPWVALKLAKPDDAETAAHLREEFLKLSQLNHPNIVSAIDFDCDEGRHFLVLEWLDGETLENLLCRITSRRIALGKAEDVIHAVAEALAHAHGRGMIHGDVKPSNIYLGPDRSIKLLDFGSSAESSGPRPGDVWATRAYASPEVLYGEAPCPADDVFSLGVTAYCLLSGRRPFGSLDAGEALSRGLVPSPLPGDARERWPVIRRALSFRRGARPVDAAQFLQEFDACLKEQDAAGAPARVAYGAIAVVLLVALVAWTVSATRGPSSDIQGMLENGHEAMSRGHLVRPDERSAWQWYSRVLESAPGNPDAEDGLRRIAETFLTRARRALAADDRRSAMASLAVARRVMPQYYGIAVTEELFARHGRDLLQRARAAAAGNPDEAERLLASAAEILSGDEDALAAVGEEVRRAKAEMELDALLRDIDARIMSERLTLPRGDSAIDLLARARRLAPDHRQVSLAAERIATALLFQSMFAISNGNLDDASAYLEAASALDVRHIALARARYELAKARHAALIPGPATD